MNIEYIKGDATRPQGNGNKIICHICNDIGAWGAGFVLAVSKRWSAPEYRYRQQTRYILGDVDIIPVESLDDETIYVANMIAQHGVGVGENGIPPIRYGALASALSRVNRFARQNNCTLHMPRIGCGLAGGDWNEVEAVIKSVVDVDVVVYDFE